MAAFAVHSDSGAQENKVCHCFHFPPSVCCEVIGPDAMILIFGMLSFKPTFSLSSFTFIKKLFSASSFSAIRVVSSTYQRVIFLPVVLIAVCDSSSPAFGMMYSVSHTGALDGKASTRNAGDLVSIPGSGRSPGEGNGNPL